MIVFLQQQPQISDLRCLFVVCFVNNFLKAGCSLQYGLNFFPLNCPAENYAHLTFWPSTQQRTIAYLVLYKVRLSGAQRQLNFFKVQAKFLCDRQWKFRQFSNKNTTSRLTTLASREDQSTGLRKNFMNAWYTIGQCCSKKIQQRSWCWYFKKSAIKKRRLFPFATSKSASW